MEVRRSQMVSSSLSPCNRYSSGGGPSPERPSMPIWVVVCWGSRTVIDVLRLSASEKKSQRRWAMRRSCPRAAPASGRRVPLRVTQVAPASVGGQAARVAAGAGDGQARRDAQSRARSHRTLAKVYLVLAPLWVVLTVLQWADDDAELLTRWLFTALAVGYVVLAAILWWRVLRRPT